MRCSNCGKEIDDSANFCPFCGADKAKVVYVKNYLVQAILVTLFCNLLFGIIAIIHAAKVDSLISKGDVVGARIASNTAKIWINISFFLFLFVLIAYIIFGAVQGWDFEEYFSLLFGY